jgi:uncharacterized protein YecE (DUF72 family)
MRPGPDRAAVDHDAIRIGTSGWQYADWRDVLYPRGLAQRDWLATYAQHFDTVEVNATFYRLPNVTAVERWADTAPSGFLFAVKASRYLTHIKRLREPEEPVARLLNRIEPLVRAGKLGPVLVQLPPDMQVETDLLAGVLRRFPPEIDVAVEPRHASWFVDAVFDILAGHNASLVWADRKGKPVTPLRRTADWCYVRLHEGRRSWGYSAADLRGWADRVRDFDRGFIYTNNDPGGAAVHDATALRRLLASRCAV